jgi:SAM-dependent methyltransferase
MKFWRRFFFEWMYFRSPPWDSGIVPPEVVNFVSHHPPGRAIDLGCGTGTNVIYLAKQGWQVVGVDFSRKALSMARRKSKSDGVMVNFIHDDVSVLSKVQGPFDLVLDIGCFHSLSPAQKQNYLQRVEELLAPDGYFLLYGFINRPPNTTSIQPEDIQAIQNSLTIVNQQVGEDKGRAAAWFLIRKKTPRSQIALKP